MPRTRNAIASTATRTPRIVTTRTPLFDEAGWREHGVDLGAMRSDIFLPRNLDDPNHVESADEIRFCAQRVGGVFGSETVRPWIETLTDLPDRQSVQSRCNDMHRPHPEETAKRSSRRMAAGEIGASWFETPLTRLLTSMRV